MFTVFRVLTSTSNVYIVIQHGNTIMWKLSGSFWIMNQAYQNTWVTVTFSANLPYCPIVQMDRLFKLLLKNRWTSVLIVSTIVLIIRRYWLCKSESVLTITPAHFGRFSASRSWDKKCAQLVPLLWTDQSVFWGHGKMFTSANSCDTPSLLQ